ncbi:hypothetical protein [Streptomyces xylophagus]|uniref:hypothetical protein n=1 Tax=Streptomyces xylophagus TaxID=285514 RepID=UPI00131E4C70|nr:hypothetical protein [Streptomyces xylophagus]
MTWNTASLFVLALFGFIGLCITLIVIFLKQLPELINAWQEMRQAISRSQRRP